MKKKTIIVWVVTDNMQKPCFDDVFPTRKSAREYMKDCWGDDEYKKLYKARIVKSKIVI